MRRRKSIRLQSHDYAGTATYFVTVVVQGRSCALGEIERGEMFLSTAGNIVLEEWRNTALVRPNVRLDAFVIMPNHIHGVLHVVRAEHSANPVRAAQPVTEIPTAAPRLESGSLGAILGQLKSITTKRIRKSGLEHFAWQRNYFEHVVRDDRSLERIRAYIVNNPLCWDADREITANSAGRLVLAGTSPA